MTNVRQNSRGEWVWVASANPPKPQLTVEANPVVGQLWAPDGQRLLTVVTARPERAVGFRPPASA
jgi:hypothetical protein